MIIISFRYSSKEDFRIFIYQLLSRIMDKIFRSSFPISEIYSFSSWIMISRIDFKINVLIHNFPVHLWYNFDSSASQLGLVRRALLNNLDIHVSKNRAIEEVRNKAREGLKIHTSTCLYSSGGGSFIASSIFGFPHFFTKASISLQIARTASWLQEFKIFPSTTIKWF